MRSAGAGHENQNWRVKEMRLLILLLLAMPVMGQEIQCVEVPENFKIVFVPWIIPTNELRWEWRAAKDVVQPDVFVVKPKCVRSVVVSPNLPCD